MKRWVHCRHDSISCYYFTAGAIVTGIYYNKAYQAIEETLVKVHRGGHEARINVIANNEYGQIARTFNDLIDDIVVVKEDTVLLSNVG